MQTLSNPDAMKQSRVRLILLSAALFGVLTAAIISLYNNMSPKGISDSEARKQGYRSADEHRITYTLRNLSKPRQQKFEYTEEQFHIAEKELREGTESGRDNVFLGFRELSEPIQQKRAMAILKPYLIKGEKNILAYKVLDYYILKNEGRLLVEEWAHDPDPAIVQEANRAIQEYDDRKKSRVTKRTGGKKGE